MHRPFFYLSLFLLSFFSSYAEQIDIFQAVRQEMSCIAPYSSKQLERTWERVKKDPNYLRFTIKKGIVFGPKGPVLNLLEAICKCYSVPNLSFIYYNHDIAPANAGRGSRLAPIFCSSKHKEDRGIILFCDWYFDIKDTEGGWKGLYNTFSDDQSIPTWDTRIEKLVWRGSTNEGGYTKENWHTKPRGQLVFLSRELFPNLIDAGFSMHHPWNVQDLSFFQNHLTCPSLSVREQALYKYQIDIDGTTATFTGMPWKLLCGSLLFKQDSMNVMWFHTFFQPYKHYIPVRSDLADLMEKLLWAIGHDEEVFDIAYRGRERAKAVMNTEALLSYCFFVLKEYAARRVD